jgi:proteasome accessory factor C
MLPWLMEVGEAPLAEVARRFELTEAQVQQDLELVAMCGLPPYVDEMVDVFVDDGTVFVGVPRLFTRPLRLTAPEGFSLLAAGRAAMQLPGADAAGPLGRGLDKLAAALGVAATDDDTAGVVIELERPPFVDLFVDAAARDAELMVRYYSPARDVVDDRTIVPRHVFVESGNWYVLADDGRSGERRTFRVDRVEAAEPTGAEIPAGDRPVERPPGFFVDDDLPRAVLDVAPSARWVVEEYPVDEVVELADGWVRVTLPSSSERWLSRLLLRLGPEVRVVGPERARTAAEALARRILERYSGS